MPGFSAFLGARVQDTERKDKTTIIGKLKNASAHTASPECVRPCGQAWPAEATDWPRKTVAGPLRVAYVVYKATDEPTMIDTLKLSNRLKAARMPSEQAEAISEGLAESLKESYVTREFLDARLASLKGEIDVLKWMVGFNLVMTVGILWRVFAH
jgi:hypothetical protein